MKLERQVGGKSPAKYKSWPSNQTYRIKIWMWVLEIYFWNKLLWHLTFSEDKNPCSRWWRTSASISFLLLYWSLFLTLISPTQGLKGLRLMAQSTLAIIKQHGQKGRTQKLPSEKQWRPGPHFHIYPFGEYMVITFFTYVIAGFLAWETILGCLTLEFPNSL